MCHGVDGNGAAGLERLSMRKVEGVVADDGATLVQVIDHGITRNVGGDHALTPVSGLVDVTHRSARHA